MTTYLSDNLLNIHQRIQLFAARYQRDPQSIKLLAASKSQSSDTLRRAAQAGLRIFGENYLQEALEKITALKDLPLEWHFMGPIQSNKTRKIAQYFSWVQSISDFKIAERLSKQRPLDLPPLNICLQINISRELTKSGIPPENVFNLASACATLPQLTLRGLMTLPAPNRSFTEQRAGFREMRLLFDNLNQHGFQLDTLSMGMSDDLEAAIAEGATLVRIGTAIFGQR